MFDNAVDNTEADDDDFDYHYFFMRICLIMFLFTDIFLIITVLLISGFDDDLVNDDFFNDDCFVMITFV